MIAIHVTHTGQMCVSSVASAKRQIKLLLRIIYDNIQYVERFNA